MDHQDGASPKRRGDLQDGPHLRTGSQPQGRGYSGEIDEFAVSCPALGTVYLVPIEDVGTTCEAMLRVDPPRNGQRKNVRIAAVYEIARFELS